MHRNINHDSSILETKEVSSSEELVLNTVATINNLSFYNTKTSAITTLQVRVLEGTPLVVQFSVIFEQTYYRFSFKLKLLHLHVGEKL